MQGLLSAVQTQLSINTNVGGYAWMTRPVRSF